MAEKLLILYASQTGNAQDVAERIGREASRRHFSPIVLSMDSCDPAQLSLTRAAVFVTATTGQGDPPDNMKGFWRFLLRKSLPPTCLQHLQYAVFGLGDSGYLKYNIVVKKLDRRLLDLGARPLVPRGLGDDQHPSGYEAALDPWLGNFWSAVRQVVPLPPGASEPSETDVPLLDPPKFKVTYISRPQRNTPSKRDVRPNHLFGQDPDGGSARSSDNAVSLQVGPGTNGGLEGLRASSISAAAVSASAHDRLGCLAEHTRETAGASAGADGREGGFTDLGEPVTAAAASGDELEENLRAIGVLDAATEASSGVLPFENRGGGGASRLGYDQANPHLAMMVANVRLTSPDNEQDVRHIELDLGDSGISYAPGDVINVMPENSGDVVRRFCERCGLDPDAEVLIESRIFGEDPEAVLENRSRVGASTSSTSERLEVNPEDDLKTGPGTCNFEKMVKQGLNAGAKNRVTLLNRAVARGKPQGEGLVDMSATRMNGSHEGPGINGMNGVSGSSGTSGTREEGAEGDCEREQSEAAEQVSLSGTDGGKRRFGPVRIGTLVRAALDVASASPRRYFFEVLAHFATAEHEVERLQYFATAEGRDDLYRYNQRERRTVLEVLDDFPSANLPLEWILQLVPRLKPRAFSISSSLLTHPNQAHITVAVVSFQTPYKRTRRGLCSHWLASLNPQTPKPVRLPVWVSKGFLKLPPPEVPMILVGPGTGCAPFRAFLEERTELAKRNGTAPPCLFFFGCRREKGDFLYRDQWLSYAQEAGVLSEGRGGGLLTAFSRDQMIKVYVTHKIKELGRKVWQLLLAGASIYVAGSANNMPADVANALQIVAQREGHMSQQEAAAWLKDLERSRRYHVEAWS